jgi:hypothetical protein
LSKKRDEYQRNKPRYEERNSQRDPEKIKQQNNSYYERNHEYVKESQYDYYHNRGGREVAQEYRRDNPRSGGGHDSFEVQIAMNEVRCGGNRQCQWGGCDSHDRGMDGIHVNHLLTRAKFPERETDKKIMVRYCLPHHAIWHKLRHANQMDKKDCTGTIISRMNDDEKSKYIELLDDYSHIIGITDNE